MTISESARVGVLMGGLSSERAVSLDSGAAVLAALASRGWDVVGIDVDRDLPFRLREEGVEVCWIALHGRYGEDGCVQGLLELMGLPYTGSGVAASAIGMDKAATKRAVRGLPDVVLARDALVRAGDPMPALGGPVVCKPASGGSSVGVVKVHAEADWAAARDAALGEDDVLLVEALIEGTEITVAVLDGDPLPVVAIRPASGTYDYAAKYELDTTVYEVPAQLPGDAAARAQRAATAAYRALGCRGLARADFLVQSNGLPTFLEINTLPGMTTHSLSPKAALAAGLSFEDLCERLLRSATTDSGWPLKPGPPRGTVP